MAGSLWNNTMRITLIKMSDDTGGKNIKENKIARIHLVLDP